METGGSTEWAATLVYITKTKQHNTTTTGSVANKAEG